MILQLLKVDFLKIKRKGLWFFSFLGPIGVVSLQMVNYALRKEYLFQKTDNHWLQYVNLVNSFTPFAIVLGIVILTSIMASIEDETSAWKQLIALPVLKRQVYLSKFTVISCLLLISSIVLLFLTYFYGLKLGLGKEVPYLLLLQQSLFPFFASLPVLGLQLWLTIVCKNQAIPITIGVLGVILAYIASGLPDWIIWKWPTLNNQWDQPYINILLCITIGIIIFFLGMIDFQRRDVK